MERVRGKSVRGLTVAAAHFDLEHVICCGEVVVAHIRRPGSGDTSQGYISVLVKLVNLVRQQHEGIQRTLTAPQGQCLTYSIQAPGCFFGETVAATYHFELWKVELGTW